MRFGHRKAESHPALLPTHLDLRGARVGRVAVVPWSVPYHLPANALEVLDHLGRWFFGLTERMVVHVLPAHMQKNPLPPEATTAGVVGPRQIGGVVGQIAC